MNNVKPLYKCRMCHSIKYGEIMSLSDRTSTQMLEDVMDFAAPVVEPHDCFGDHTQYGVWEYSGFQVL